MLPISKGAKVYFPKRYYPASIAFFGRNQPAIPHYDWQIDTAVVNQYYQFTEDPNEADFALLYIYTPEGNWGYSEKDVQQGGTGYVPISLQYEDYTATQSRSVSIAGGDSKESFTNRSYLGKSDYSYNRQDMLQVIETKKLMGDKPVIVLLQAARPFVPAEIEPYTDGLLLGFGIKDEAYLDILCGNAEPYGLLPMQLPKDMQTVELQMEDVARDMECYTDADGHTYDFAFGLNWSGVIRDARVRKYQP